MEELLKQVLENQLAMSKQFMEFQENQLEIIKQIGTLENRLDSLEKQMNERFEKIEKRVDSIEKQMNEGLKKMDEKFDSKLFYLKKETEEKFKKLEKKLDDNLADIAFIFEQYNNRFMKANQLKKIN